MRFLLFVLVDLRRLLLVLLGLLIDFLLQLPGLFLATDLLLPQTSLHHLNIFVATVLLRSLIGSGLWRLRLVLQPSDLRVTSPQLLLKLVDL